MTVRSLVDARGVEWRVWATHAGAVSEFTSARDRDDWLTFDSIEQRRRLSPIPADWTTASLAVLEQYLDSADRVPIHLGRLPRLDRTE